MIRRALLLHVLGLASAMALADEATIRRVMESKLGGAKIEGIQPGPIPGIFEVRFRSAEGIQIVYTDAKASYAIMGSIYDLRTSRNVTEERRQRLNAVKFDSLPLSQAVKIQRGNGKRVVAMFSDPYCPYCQQFEKTLQQVDDITVYVFMYPVIRPDLADHSKAVWCAPDRAKAWLDLALRGNKAWIGTVSCDTPVEKNIELGRSLGINSTPTLIFSNGDRVSGGISAPDLRDLLEAAASGQARGR